MKVRAVIVSALLCAAGGVMAATAGGSKPDIAAQHAKRVNCHGAYDVLVEDLQAKRPVSSAETAWAQSYEAAATAKQPCPDVPAGLTERAVNRTVVTDSGLGQLSKYSDAGDAAAKFEIANTILTGKFTKVEPAVGWTFLKQASDAGDPSALFLLGSVHVAGLLNQNKADYASGAPLIERSAQVGHIDSLFMAGNMYKDGLGVRKNTQKAFDYYRQAAERGHPYATIMAFTMINDGEVKKDFDLAYRLGRNMAEQGEVYGAVMAASALLQSRDVLSHKDEVLYWMDTVMRDGDAELKAQIGPLRAKAIEIYNRPPPPPREYRPRPFKACPMKTTCYVTSSGLRHSCTTNKDYWNDCDG